MMLKDNIKQRREELGLTLEAVAKIVGVTRATVQKYENGIISNVPSDKIELLAKVLRTTPSHLMGWDEKAQGVLLEENPAIAGGEELTEDMKKLLMIVQDADDDVISQISQYADFLKSQRNLAQP